MMLTLVVAPSGHGMLLRDTNTRAEVYIDHTEMLSIAQTLITHANQQASINPRIRKGPNR